MTAFGQNEDPYPSKKVSEGSRTGIDSEERWRSDKARRLTVDAILGLMNIFQSRVGSSSLCLGHSDRFF